MLNDTTILVIFIYLEEMRIKNYSFSSEK